MHRERLASAQRAVHAQGLHERRGNDVRELGVRVGFSSGGRVIDCRSGSKGRWAHVKAKAGDEREGTGLPDGKHRNAKRMVFGTDLCVNRGGKSDRQRQTKEREIGTRPSKMGHGPLVVMYPVPLQMKI
jgi:hypothetical protein